MPFGNYGSQAEYNAFARSQLVEHAAVTRQSDADRLLERRLIAVGEGLRRVLAEHSDLFSGDADVPEAAAAAVNVLARG